MCSMTNRETTIPQHAVCPTHGPVEAAPWKGAIVCPDPECHRTCAPVDEGTPAPLTFVLGDRCRKCLHWYWPEDGKWHSLIPIHLADDPAAGDYTCTCPVCRRAE